MTVFYTSLYPPVNGEIRSTEWPDKAGAFEKGCALAEIGGWKVFRSYAEVMAYLQANPLSQEK